MDQQTVGVVSAARVHERVRMAGPSEAVRGCGASGARAHGKLAADGVAPGTLGAVAASTALVRERVCPAGPS